jgi:hypothetical protein
MDYDTDYGDMSGLDFGDIDLSGLDLGNLDLGGLDLGDIDLSGLEGLDFGSNVDLGSFEDLAAVDNLDIGALLGGGGESIDKLTGGAGMDDNGEINSRRVAIPNIDNFSRDEQGFEDLIQRFSGEEGGGPLSFNESEYGKNLNTANLENSNFDKAKADQAEYQRYLDSLTSESPGTELGAGTGAQDYGASTDVDKSQSDMADRGGKLPSGWQKSSDGSYVNIREDGTANGIDQDGNSFTLSESQVQARIKSGDLNTFKSGYNTATGGTKIAPGGGSPVTLKNGKEGQLMPDGKVIDKDTGKVIGTEKDVKTENKPGSGPGSGSNTGKSNDLKFLLPLLLAMMAMNRGSGGGGSGAVIPSLSADRKQLPYGPSSGEVKRPGAGGTTYFSPTTYTKKAAGGGMMYGGGGISNLGGYSDGGRLLRGPGDGVSDSIPATIGGKQPARLATGEFVVPARIVSELGNGSTEAGAKKLYAMMDRVQKARRKTKNVAADTKAHKYLPA